MSPAELQEHLSRYLAESRVRDLSLEEKRRMEELMQTQFFDAVPTRNLAILPAQYDVIRIDVVTPLVREFARNF
jgi:hypothetical protein